MVNRSFWIERVERALDRRSIVWLHGVRRVGKTVLCRSLHDVEYFDCELPGVRRQLQDPERFLRSLGPPRRAGQGHAPRIVLDEIHRLPDPAQLLKIAADHFSHVAVIATGSSTLAATAKFSDSLTGRKVSVWLTPMIRADLAAFGDTSLERRLWHGGIPPFFLSAATTPAVIQERQEWLDSFWARDIQELFRVEKRNSFLRFAELVLANSGGVFEATAYAGPCEVSRPTITTYLGVLEQTRVAHVVKPYSTRKATEIVSAPKVYAFDTGFVRHARELATPRPEDLGSFWEHYVLNEVHACAPYITPRYWRTKQGQQVDFVFTRTGLPPLAVECKWSDSSPGQLRGLKGFLRAYPGAEGLIVVPEVSREYLIAAGDNDVTVTDLAGLIARLSSTRSHRRG